MSSSSPGSTGRSGRAGVSPPIPRRRFGPSGHRVPVLGQGTWNLEREERATALAALRRGLDAGLAHIDTAEMYGGGRVEELVGEALRGRRDEVFLVSKLLPQNASRRGTLEACDRSLRRLATDHLDGYLLHWWGSHPLEETIAAFEELEATGKIGCWGVSNFDEAELARALAIAGADRIACNQVLYHLEERAIEHAVLPFCERHRIAVVAYSPLGSGRFPDPGSRGGRVLEQVARRHGVGPGAVALAFLLRRGSLFAIPKAARAEHISENAAAAAVSLDEADVLRLERAFPRGPRRPGVPIL